jgi:hypothetical protein
VEEIQEDHSAHIFRRRFTICVTHGLNFDAVSQRNNRLVWDETVNIMNDLFDNMWSNKEVVTVDHCRDITLPVRPSLLPKTSC